MYHDLQDLCSEYTSCRELASSFTLSLAFLGILNVSRKNSYIRTCTLVYFSCAGVAYVQLASLPKRPRSPYI
jgi:hypothetical protein